MSLRTRQACKQALRDEADFQTLEGQSQHHRLGLGLGLAGHRLGLEGHRLASCFIFDEESGSVTCILVSCLFLYEPFDEEFADLKWYCFRLAACRDSSTFICACFVDGAPSACISRRGFG